MKLVKHLQLPILLLLLLLPLVSCVSEQKANPTSALLPTKLLSTSTMSTVTETFTSTVEPSQTLVAIDPDPGNSTLVETNIMNIQIGDNLLTATLVENSSTSALKELLSKGPISINMRDYGSMEKVGLLGMNLPTNDQQITTEAGDIILYQGNALVIYYAPNSWNFTRLGKINNVTSEILKEILGDGNVTITISLPD